MDYRKRGSHARSVYPTHYTSRLETERKKQEERANTIIMQERNLEDRNVGKKGKSLKQDLSSAKDLTIELPER